MIWGGGIGASLMFLGLFAWWKVAMLIVGHMLVDAWKCRLHYKKLGLSDMGSLYVDQALHVVQLLICLI